MPKVLTETLGPELITNGNFTGSADGWTVNYDPLPLENWSYGTNNVVHTPGENMTEALRQEILSWDSGERLGKKFYLKFNIGGSAGTIQVTLGGNVVGGNSEFTYAAGVGAVEIGFVVPESIGNNDIAFYPSADFDGTIDSVSVKEYIAVWTDVADPLKINSILVNGHYICHECTPIVNNPDNLGPELITNGDFDGSANNWNLEGFEYGNKNIVVGNYTDYVWAISGVGISLEAGKTYEVSIEIGGNEGTVDLEFIEAL